MKRHIVIVLSLAAFVLVGCNTIPSTATYKTLAAVETSTTTAFQAYLTGVIKGAIPSNSVPAVTRDYDIFQAVMAATVTVAAQGSNAPVTTAVSDAAAKVLTDINTPTSTSTK